jgi:hypothetical protein
MRPFYTKTSMFAMAAAAALFLCSPAASADPIDHILGTLELNEPGTVISFEDSLTIKQTYSGGTYNDTTFDGENIRPEYTPRLRPTRATGCAATRPTSGRENIFKTYSRGGKVHRTEISSVRSGVDLDMNNDSGWCKHSRDTIDNEIWKRGGEGGNQ